MSGSPSSNTFTTHLKATSTAGVAQGDWSQKLKSLRTISGTFTGQHTDGQGTLSWSGTATFQRADDGAGIAGAFQLTSGQATVTVSGTDAAGCSVSGSATVTLQTNSVWGVQGDKKPYTYQIVASFGSPGSIPGDAVRLSGFRRGRPQHVAIRHPPFRVATFSADSTRPPPTDSPTPAAPVLRSPSDPGESESWTWSMTGTIS